jgi:zinc protease
MKTFSTLLLFLLLSICSFAQFTTYADDPINVKKYVLKNGLTVLLSENHDVPQVFGMVVVKAGGKHDPEDATGLAHYLEHMLFKGTTTLGTTNFNKEKPYLEKINDLYEELGKTKDSEDRKKIQKKINEESVLAAEYAIPNEMDRMLTEIGSTGVNAFTTEEYTAYHNTFPANQMERWLEIYSHRFKDPVFRLFQSELETVYEEKNRFNDNAFGQVYEKLMASFYKQHPYGQQPIIGTTEHLKNPPLKKMYEYFSTYYVANNMAIILSGDFVAEEILPLIEEKFGDWRTGEVPVYPVFQEQPFKGREKVEVKMTPIKAAVLGFRTVPNGHKDLAALRVCNDLLSNDAQSGLIDKLNVNGELMMAGLISFVYNDYGGSAVFVVPKIIGQSIGQAEELVKKQLALVKEGNFSEEMLQAVKLNLRKQIISKWENNYNRVNEIAKAFAQGSEWDAYFRFEQEVAVVSKADVIEVASKYYGNDYLMFISKMGFPKKEKLEKPGFDPVIPKNDVNSEYYFQWKNIPEKNIRSKFVDINKEVRESAIKERVNLFTNENPFNSVFSAEIKFGAGNYKYPNLLYAADYLNLIGSKNLSAMDFKNKLYEFGCSYSFSISENELSLNIEGMEEFLPEALSLINDLVNNPETDDKKVKKIINDRKAAEKVQKREPAYIADALQQWVKFGKESSYLRELSKQKLNQLKVDDLIKAFDDSKKHEVTINYTGQKSHEDVKKLFSEQFQFKIDLEPKMEHVLLERILPTETIIYFVNKKNAIQSQIYFNIEGAPLDIRQIPYIDAFNEYFGNDMSSLVFQEIREFRSLAYSAYANYSPAKKKEKNNLFTGYIGCHSDKTTDAMEAMLSLINNMPEKIERENIIRSALLQSSMSARPDFRSLISATQKWKELGYNDDPNRIKSEVYKEISFEHIREIYLGNIKNKPIIITIVGDAKTIDQKKLGQFGKVISVNEKELFVK